jgi:hypothetical protein
MITLTPDEAREYERGGTFAAIWAFRNRTNLGLVESKRAVEMWLAGGKPVSEDGKPSFESETMAKLADALTRLREAEKVIYQQRRQAMEIAIRVMSEAGQQEETQRDTWYRACSKITDALGAELPQQP